MAFLALTSVLACQSLVGSKLSSDLSLDFGFPPKKINLAERVGRLAIPFQWPLRSGQSVRPRATVYTINTDLRARLLW